MGDVCFEYGISGNCGIKCPAFQSGECEPCIENINVFCGTIKDCDCLDDIVRLSELYNYSGVYECLKQDNVKDLVDSINNMEKNTVYNWRKDLEKYN